MNCKNCGKPLTKTQISKKNECCCKGCATSFRQKAHDPNPLKEDNELKYYLLGLIYSDGNLSLSKNKEKLSIRLNDKDIIDKIYPKFCDISKRIIYKEYFSTSKGQICSYMIVNTNIDCINEAKALGITTRKSLTIIFPNIDRKFYKDFIRGYFDGDGSVYKSSKYKDTIYYGISFTSGSKDFLDTLSSILRQYDIDSNIVKDKRHYSCYSLKIYKQDSIKKLFEFMYNDSTYFIQRKYNIFVKDIV